MEGGTRSWRRLLTDDAHAGLSGRPGTALELALGLLAAPAGDDTLEAAALRASLGRFIARHGRSGETAPG